MSETFIVDVAPTRIRGRWKGQQRDEVTIDIREHKSAILNFGLKGAALQEAERDLRTVSNAALENWARDNIIGDFADVEIVRSS